MNRGFRIAVTMAVAAGALVATGSSAKATLAMLDQLDAGSWELRVRDDGGRVERMCLQDGRGLIQLRHRVSNCQSVVVSDGASEVTVQYTCRGHGYGRTHIRRETDRLVQLDSQGVVDGLPFAFAAEARRVGDCQH